MLCTQVPRRCLGGVATGTATPPPFSAKLALHGPLLPRSPPITVHLGEACPRPMTQLNLDFRRDVRESPTSPQPRRQRRGHTPSH